MHFFPLIHLSNICSINGKPFVRVHSYTEEARVGLQNATGHIISLLNKSAVEVDLG